MKNILFTTLFLFPFLSFGQLPTVSKATSQGWAGGACCVSGTNYSITISGSEEILKDFKVNSVCIGGNKFDTSMVTVNAYTKENIKYIILSMGIVNSEYPRDFKIIDKTPPCPDNEVNFNGCKSSYTLQIDKVEELMFVAYP